MYCSFCCVCISSSEATTFLKKNSDLFISIAYLLKRPTAPNSLSDPAKSTK
jgi:hypothetical protein